VDVVFKAEQSPTVSPLPKNRERTQLGISRPTPKNAELLAARTNTVPRHLVPKVQCRDVVQHAVYGQHPPEHLCEARGGHGVGAKGRDGRFTESQLWGRERERVIRARRRVTSARSNVPVRMSVQLMLTHSTGDLCGLVYPAACKSVRQVCLSMGQGRVVTRRCSVSRKDLVATTRL
jgi:hypothetical protein